MKNILTGIFNIFRFILRDLIKDGWRTTITVVNLMIFITCYFCLAALSQASLQFGKQDENKNSLLVISKNILDPGDSLITLDQFAPILELEPDQVETVAPLVFRLMNIESYLIQVRGTQVENMQNVFSLELTAGRWPEKLDEVVIGEGTAQLTKWQLNKVIKIFGRNFTIVGKISSPGSKSSSVWMTLDAAENLYNTHDSYQFAWVKVSRGVDAEVVKENLQNDPRISGNFDVFFVDYLYAQYADALDDVGEVTGLLAFLSTLLIMFGTYGSIYLTLSERNREITILRAIGLRAAAIRMILALRTGFQIVIALFGSWGLAILLLDHIQKKTPLIVRSAMIDVVISGKILIIGIILAFLFGGIGIWIPTISLNRTSVYSAIQQR
ncbi:MAG: ABC transporter permease [Chloroflexota bacterium]